MKHKSVFSFGWLRLHNC